METDAYQAISPSNSDSESCERLEAILGLDASEWLSEKDLHEAVSIAQVIETEIGAETVFGIAVAHPDPRLRRSLIPVVEQWLPHPTAMDTIGALTRDPDDLVCLPAIDVVGRKCIESAIPYLVQIVAWPSTTSRTPGKPVGMGAAHVQRALERALSFGDGSLISSEAYARSEGRLPPARDTPLELPEELTTRFAAQTFDDMCFVPSGPYVIGLDAHTIPGRAFDWTDAAPRSAVWLPPFWIDQYPVTNEEYDLFDSAIGKHQHFWCHPQEPVDKIHTRNTYRDSRFPPDAPATGIDWFDAYAYCRWTEKQLPTEFQWEAAARGPQGTTWPWGDDWDPARCHWLGSLSPQSRHTSTDLQVWRSAICDLRDSDLALTSPVTAHEGGASPFDVRDMVGNAWEWTRSNRHDRLAFVPSMLEEAIAERKTIGVVIKGGSWSSIPDLMFPSYRGQDSPLCRHNEIGFRGVRNMPYKSVDSINRAGRRNTAVY